MHQWAADCDIKKAVNALRVAAAVGQVEKGSLTPKMFDDFVSWLSRSELKHWQCLRCAALVAVGASSELRITELWLLRVGDATQLRHDPSSDQLLVMRINKDHRVERDCSYDKQIQATVGSVLEAWSVFAQAEAWRTFLPTRQIGKILAEALQNAATALEWPTGFLWGQTNVMRITGAAQIENRVGDILREWFSGQSAQVFHSYARPLESRKRARAPSDL